jgi:hypothetical protein
MAAPAATRRCRHLPKENSPPLLVARRTRSSEVAELENERERERDARRQQALRNSCDKMDNVHDGGAP